MTATFKDFSKDLPEHWKYQSADPSGHVRVYLTEGYLWCREVANVRVKEVNGWLVPEPGQIITYPQKVRRQESPIPFPVQTRA